MRFNPSDTERLTYSEERRREAAFWASKSIAERVIAGWELAERSLTQEERDELRERKGKGWRLVRVPHRTSNKR